MKSLAILAGGKGTRLKDRLGDLPKPMIPVGGKPLLEHQVELARKYGFTDLVFFTSVMCVSTNRSGLPEPFWRTLTISPTVL